jgi:hypothetical protein
MGDGRLRPAITFAARALTRAIAQLCFLRKIRGEPVWRMASVANREVSSNCIARDTRRPADELINIQALVLALDQMGSPADEMEAVG